LHDNITDSATVLLVRQILELAIAKYGSLGIDEGVRSSQLSFERRWGGYLALSVADMFKQNQREIRALLTSSDESSQLELASFRPGNLRDLFGAEGYAYEYWLCTARLRSIGKGRKLWYEPNSSTFHYEPAPSISEPFSALMLEAGK
jgi:hypothetical protein